MDTIHNKKTRRNYLINPNFQWKMIRWMTILSIATSFIYFISNFVFFSNLKALGVSQHLSVNSLYFKFINQQQYRMNLIFLITTLIAIVIIVGFGIYSSHRIAGPIYRMCKHLKESDPKDFSSVKFRKNDFFPELADSFNDFHQKWKGHS